MKSLVIDGSTTLGFILQDEQSAEAMHALELIEKGILTHVPTHWWLETANGLIMAERRNRASQADIVEALNVIQLLPVVTDTETARMCGGNTASLARQYTLTIYDAAYLELAIRNRSTLATNDHALAKAAHSVGLPVLKR